MEDKYIGQKYNRLTIISYSRTTTSPSGRKYKRYLCQCECGEITECELYNITTGAVKSCGCLAKEIQEQKMLNEMIGKKFGRLTVLSKIESHVSDSGRVCSVWHCKCDCGNECNIRGTQLRSGKTQSCGCLQKERTIEASSKDLTGQRFGRLLAVERISNTGTELMTEYKCLCDCGNTIIVRSGNLVSGHTTSCGCIKNEKVHGRYEDLTGRSFGLLTVTKKIGTITRNSGNKVCQWECLCKCGNTTIAVTQDLKNNRKISCGCLLSHGELATKNYLVSHNIEFEPQKKFDDLIGTGGGQLSYDFYLPNYNLLIEYQGEQHYEPVKYFGGEEGLKIRQEHDRRKREYAQKNNIKLLEIIYKDYDKIDSILDNKLFQLDNQIGMNTNDCLYQKRTTK